jgi:hypothetical protein
MSNRVIDFGTRPQSRAPPGGQEQEKWLGPQARYNQAHEDPLHGWQSTPDGLKSTFLRDRGHEVLNPDMPDDDFDEAGEQGNVGLIGTGRDVSPGGTLY